MKVQIVTPYRVSHLQRYGVTVCGNVTSVHPPLVLPNVALRRVRVRCLSCSASFRTKCRLINGTEVRRKNVKVSCGPLATCLTPSIQNTVFFFKNV
jgi:hypothetical protein